MPLVHRLYASLLLLLVAQPAAGASIDETVELWVRPITAALSSVVLFEINFFGQATPLIVLWLVTAALFFTLYMAL